MYLEKLQLLNFKNFEEANVDFSSRINVLVGKNGSGKTNFLDAIYYLSLTKSAFSTSDSFCVRQGQNAFMVKGHFQMEGRLRDVLCSFQSGQKKVLREDQRDYGRASDHIGKYPLVLIAPDDTDLVKEGSDSRRKFFDGILCQLDKKYLEDLLQYNQALKLRNGLLRLFQQSGSVDWLAIEAYDDVLVPLGTAIHARRTAFIGEFLPVFNKYYDFIVSHSETTSLNHESELSEIEFRAGLERSRSKDLLLQRTSFGVHRDDYTFKLGDGDLKRLGSQGQQKSFVIALKLAQFEILEKHKGFKPILLLDDIFDKLDDDRIARLLELIKGDLGQLFITDARPDRTRGLLDHIHAGAIFFQVEQGKIEVQ